MREWKAKRIVAALAVLALGAVVRPSAAAAHCDSMDGPVVSAARAALESVDVAPALAWVRAEDEAEIRDAFRRTLEVRRPGGTARELADRWFFETLVRVHREGEGAPYTGLKPAGHADAGIEAADRALAEGAGDALAARIAARTADALKTKYARVLALRGYDPADVEAGRRYVHAYVEYIHFVEELHGVVSGGGEDHGAGAGDHSAGAGDHEAPAGPRHPGAE